MYCADLRSGFCAPLRGAGDTWASLPGGCADLTMPVRSLTPANIFLALRACDPEPPACGDSHFGDIVGRVQCSVHRVLFVLEQCQ